MERDVFMAGVRPGGPGTQTEIKMLLCHILSKIEKNMSFQQLYEALEEAALVNYFTLVQSLDELEASGLLFREVLPDGGDSFQLTQSGREAAAAFETTLPLTVRERGISGALRILQRETRLEEVSVTWEELPRGGFRMELSIPQPEDAPLVSFSLFSPTREQCELIRRRFLNAPGLIYKGVLALLTGDEEILDETFPQKEDQLF